MVCAAVFRFPTLNRGNLLSDRSLFSKNNSHFPEIKSLFLKINRLFLKINRLLFSEKRLLFPEKRLLFGSATGFRLSAAVVRMPSASLNLRSHFLTVAGVLLIIVVLSSFWVTPMTPVTLGWGSRGSWGPRFSVFPYYHARARIITHLREWGSLLLMSQRPLASLLRTLSPSNCPRSGVKTILIRLFQKSVKNNLAAE